jgi:eukaryotic-like serine/threonine-protein kinase
MKTTLPQYIDRRYRIEQEIGQGGMGIVYRALDRLTGQTVALKQLLLPVEILDFMSRSTSDDLRLSLTREFQLAASLRHPYIVSVYGYGFVERQPYLTMELIKQAQPVGAALHEHALEQKLTWVRQLLQALVYLHRRGIIHRDLKPSNILLTGEGSAQCVKILDFGLSIRRGEQRDTEGTLAYIAPEILRGEVASESADLYAVGIICFELLTGQHPFYHPDEEALIKNIMESEVSLEQVDLPESIRVFLRRLLAKLPSRRYRSAQEALMALNRILTTQGDENTAIRESFLKAAAFVGRERELAQLQQALSTVLAGKPAAYLLAGESGIGKSRLLNELRINAVSEGCLVLEGQAVNGDTSVHPLWKSVLRQLVIRVEVTDGEAAVLKEVVQDIEALLERPITASPPLEGAVGLQRLGLTVLDLFRRLNRPCVLILEDLHWAGASLEILKQLLKGMQTLPVLLVASYRDDEMSDLPGKLPDVQLIKLERLTQEAIVQLTASALGSGGSKTNIVDLIQRETEGNVLFVVEVIRTLAEEFGGLNEIAHKTLPTHVFAGGVEQMIRRRLERIPSSTYPLLQLAAVIGRQIDLNLLHLADANTVLQDWLIDMYHAAILEPVQDTWRFNHDKLREVILADLTPERRILLNRQAALLTEKVYPDQPELFGSMMRYWRNADEPDKERNYLMLYLQQKLDRGDYTQLDQICQRGLSLVNPSDVEAKVKLLLALGRTYERQTNYQQAKDTMQSALDLARSQQALELLPKILWHLGTALERRGDTESASILYKEGLDVATQYQDQRFIQLCMTGLGNVAWDQGTTKPPSYIISIALNWRGRLEI